MMRGAAKRRGGWRRALLAGIVLTLACSPRIALAQEPPTHEESPFPPPDYEVVPRVLALEEEAAAVGKELSVLLEVSSPRRTLHKLGEREQALKRRFDLLPRDHVLTGDEIAQLGLQAEEDRGRLAALLDTVSQRYRRLEELHDQWQREESFFERWRRELGNRPDAPGLASELTRARRATREVLTRLAEARPDLARLQQEVQSLVQQNRILLDRIETLTVDWEDRLRGRIGPSLFSRAFNERLRTAIDLELLPGLGAALTVDTVFLADNGNLILLQFLLFVTVALGALRLRSLIRGEVEREPSRWRGILSHPWALGSFTSVVIVGPYYEPAPGLWRLLLALGLAGSVGLIAHSTFEHSRRRRAAYALAVIYLLFQVGEALAPPTPLYRLFVLGLCLVSMPLFLFLAGREARERGGLSPVTLILRGAALALGVVAAAEVLGYHVLARWLLESALETTFLVFVVLFLIRLVRTILRRFFRGAWVERSEYWRQMGDEVAARLGRIAEIVLIVLGVLYAVAFWDVATSPGRAWEAATGASVHLGQLEITVAQVLLGMVALYLSVLLSRLLRALVDTELTPKHGLEKGVGDSIKALLHYTLILVGFLFALSFVGIPVESFAIVAGALGVGIGFGLQDVVNNFLSGLILLFERPVRVGDTVVLDGEWGAIQRIGLRSTVIETFDRSELIVPNSKLISQTVTNWTLSHRVARAVFPVGVAYGSDYERVLVILGEVAAAHPNVLAEPAPFAVLTGFGDSSVDFEVRASIDDIDHRLRTLSDLLREIARRFAAEGIEIPFPRRDLHLRWVDSDAAGKEAAGKLGGVSEGGGAGPGGRPRSGSAPAPPGKLTRK